MLELNHVFISYNNKDENIAGKLEKGINDRLGKSFKAKLVRHRADTGITFTDRVIEYFKKCNVFIVLLTENSVKEHFVNHEFGYAECLKKLGQIQLGLCIKEKNLEKTELSGFYPPNIDFFEFERGDPNSIELMITNVVEFLKNKEGSLIPSLTENQLKFKLFLEEVDNNVMLLENLIEGKMDILIVAQFIKLNSHLTTDY